MTEPDPQADIGTARERQSAATEHILSGARTEQVQVGEVDWERLQQAMGRETQRDHLGRYPVEGALGSGGMGEVLLVRDGALGRSVAAKLIRGEAGERQLHKFEVEAQVTGQLEHPGIVPLYELGRDASGQLYFTMKRVDGRDLADVIADLRRTGEGPDLGARLGVFLKICDAVAFAHSRGVLHRDLKPANVMVGGYGEVLVVDWGLAKVVGLEDTTLEAVTLDTTTTASGPLLTMEGTVCGTPAYMPPEQAEGRIADLDARADVYALGAILYEMLTLQPPYTGGTPWDVLAQVTEGPPLPPRRRAPEQNIPWELGAIAMRALASDPADRYPDALALAADVQAYLGAQLVSAARYRPWQRAARWVRRHPTAAMAIALLALFAAIGGAAGSMLSARRAAAEQDAAEARRRAEKAEWSDLLRRGEIEKLSASLGLERRAERNAVVLAFQTIYAEHLSKGGTDDELATYLGAVRLREFLAAFDALFVAHSDHGVAVGPADYDMRGSLRRYLADHAGAIADFTTSIALEPTARRFRRRGDARRDGGDVPGAIADYTLALKRDPNHVGALSNRGAMYLETNDLERARGDLDRAVELSPGAPIPVLNRGILRHRTGDPAGAIADFTRAAELSPGLARAYYNRGNIHLDAKRYKTAIADYDRALAADPVLVSAIVNRGLARQYSGKLRDALGDFNHAVGISANHVKARANRAYLRRILGDPRGAVEDYSKALELQPNDAILHNDRALAYQFSGDGDRARADFDKAIALDPELAAAWANRGRLRGLQGDRPGGIADLTRGIELGVLPDMYLHRGLIHVGAKAWKAAEADFDKAIAARPDNAVYRVNRSNVRIALKNYPGAVEDATLATERNPRGWMAWYNLAVGLANQRQDKAALTALDSAIRWAPKSRKAGLKKMQDQIRRRKPPKRP